MEFGRPWSSGRPVRVQGSLSGFSQHHVGNVGVPACSPPGQVLL